MEKRPGEGNGTYRGAAKTDAVLKIASVLATIRARRDYRSRRSDLEPHHIDSVF